MIRVTFFLAIGAVCASEIAHAETVVATRTIRAQTVLVPSDLAMKPGVVPDTIYEMSEAIGRETRVVLYKDQPIRPENIGPAALVERNQIVTLIYRTGPLTITTTGRALGRAGADEQLRILNLESKANVVATINHRGEAVVQP